MNISFKFFKIIICYITFSICSQSLWAKSGSLKSFFKKLISRKIVPISILNKNDECNHCEENICSICLESVDKDINTLLCGHSFHSKCLEDYINFNIREGKKLSCPNCRAIFRGRSEWVYHRENKSQFFFYHRRNKVSCERVLMLHFKIKEGNKQFPYKE